jgi:hypothetical protein
MLKGIRPIAVTELVIDGKTVKKGTGVSIKEESEKESSPPKKKKWKIVPKAEYSVEINE